jgi:hypothetical protein
MHQVYNTASLDQCPLFLDLLPRMVAELEASNVAACPRERPLEQELWDFLKHRNRNPVVGRRIALNRFGGVYNAALLCSPWWTVMMWERTHLAIESGALRGKALADRIAKHVARAASSSDYNNSTDGRRISLEDKALRACCASAVAISVMTLQETVHRRTVEIIVRAGEPLNRWHTLQNRCLRNVSETKVWVMSQLSSDFMNHVCEFPALLVDPSAVVAAGFIVDDVGKYMKLSAHDLEL